MSVYRGDDPALFDRALCSMEEQDCSDTEVRIYLCVDGPVGDGINSVIDAHAASLFKVLRNPTNIGLAASLNRLIDALEDEIFVFRMDSDDFSRPDRVARQIQVMHDRPDIDILGGAITEVNEQGKALKTLHYPKEDAEIRKCFAKRSPLAHPTVCFRRSAIEQFKNYPDYSVAQDVALWFKCLKLGLRISNMDEVLVEMTVSDTFFQRRGRARAYKEFQVWRRGIWETHGLNWRLIYPILRLGVRLAPSSLTRFLYKSRLR